MAKIVDLLKIGLIGTLLLFFLGLGIKTSVVMPEHAIVLVDSAKRVYLAPRCVLETQIGLTRTTIGEARQAGLKPDPVCRDTGAFTQEGRSLSGILLEKIGILSPLQLPWRPDESSNIQSGITSVQSTETPKSMLQNVHTLTEAAAVLQICFESPVYKTLSSEKALELHGLLIGIGNLVGAIGKHYNDNTLYMTYEVRKSRMSSDQELKQYAKVTYHFCDEKLFSEMRDYLIDSEKIINEFLSRHRQN
ncbi:MAG: hypothetical protein CV089_14420 [Nitrospira sp. WS110]|nr:hypothetical protein [Nitrospira sp. WS110]